MVNHNANCRFRCQQRNYFKTALNSELLWNMAAHWYSSEISAVNIYNPSERKNSPNSLSEGMRNDITNSIRNIMHLPEKDSDKISPAIVAVDVDRADERDQNNIHFHRGLVNRAFLPLRFALIIVGRWPFQLKTKSVSTHPFRQANVVDLINRQSFSDRVKAYDSSFSSPLWIYFGVTTLFTLAVLTVSTLGFFDVLLEWQLFTSIRWGVLTKQIFRKNLVIFLLVWSCLLHSAVSSLSLLRNRKQVVNFLNYWNFAADQLRMTDDIMKKHRRFLIIVNCAYLLFLVLIYLAYNWWKYVSHSIL